MKKNEKVTRTEQKIRWMKKAYKSYSAHLRYDTDKDIIDYIEQEKKSQGVTDIFRKVFQEFLENEKKKG